ncbi:MAG: hypothetical protein WCU88_09895 [Elusimicrobiota bacterium]
MFNVLGVDAVGAGWRIGWVPERSNGLVCKACTRQQRPRKITKFSLFLKHFQQIRFCRILSQNGPFCRYLDKYLDKNISLFCLFAIIAAKG